MVGLLACGLLAAGCGSDDSTSTAAVSSTEATTSSADTSTTEATTSDDTSTTEDTTSDDTSSSGGTTPDDVYQACLDAISGTAAEDAAKPSCDQAKAAFEQCAQQAASAGGDAATAICQSAADEAIKQLQAAGAGG
jgi:hypothetical protein